jgi:lysophospholipase L1-like esterase
VVQSRPFALALDDGWHEAVVTLGPRPSLEVDGRRIPLTIGVGPGAKRFALRGSGYPTLVDDVRLDLRDGSVRREDFGRGGGLVRASWLGAAVLAVIELAVRAARARARRAWWLRIALAVAFALCAGLAWTAQTLVLGKRYPLEIETDAFSSGIETPAQVVGRLVSERDDRPAIIALGGSQTWGAGAAHLEDVWSARLERALGDRYKVWNFGISGQDAGDQIALLHQVGLSRRPELVIAVFGTNEVDAEALGRALDALAALGREHGFGIVLVEEPVAHDAPKFPGFWEYREAIEAAGARHALPVADLHAALVRKRDRALMWWDFAHLSSQGHALFEEALRPAVERALAARAAASSATQP